MICGIIDKHPEEKATRRSLVQAVEKNKAELSTLDADYQHKFKSYQTVEN